MVAYEIGYPATVIPVTVQGPIVAVIVVGKVTTQLSELVTDAVWVICWVKEVD